MANKKTVVQMYEELLALPNLTDEQKTFIEGRIEITMKKNANRGNGTSPKEIEKANENAAIENAVVAALAPNTAYAATAILGLLTTVNVPNTQKLTPRLTALVNANRLVKTTEKGRTTYSLPAAE